MSEFKYRLSDSPGTVTSSNLASNAVTSSNITDSAITIKDCTMTTDHTSGSYHYTGGYGTSGAPYQYPWQVNPNTGYPIPQPQPNQPQPEPHERTIYVEVEVLVRECPSCEEVKRVDDDWTEGDYICNDCRGL